MPVDPRIADLLIAGAGPAGCTLALYLAQRGFAVTLLEAEPTLPLDLRASTFHPPSLDLLESIGVTERILPLGLVSPTYQYRDRRSGDIAEFDLGVLAGETRHPYRLQCEQYKMTQVACDMLRAQPSAQVHFSHRVIDVRQEDDRLVAITETPSATREFAGRYLVGADGASSAVRRAIGVEFEGFTYPERFLVVSTPFDFATVFPRLSNVNYVSDPDEWCVILKTLTLWRVLFPTDPAAEEGDLLSEAFVQQRLHRLHGKAGDYEIGHRTLYRVHQRVAREYRRGRVLLAGDAAHINNPLGGMGMNGGLHDAFNLAEKLVAILEGRGSEDLLDLYDRQRRTLAQKFVQEHTIRNKELMESRDPEMQRRRQAEFARTAADPVLAKRFLMKTSMIESLRESASIR
jgi:3-(3-hydroxy-phenyl)propionate hydroxylase